MLGLDFHVGGLLNSAVIARLSLVMLTSNVTKAEFESLWHAGSTRSAEQP